MKKKILKVAILVLFVCIATLNIVVLYPQPTEAAEPAFFNWVYVANLVWHCDASTELHCKPKSAHQW